jgi:predicted transcriptional regulator
LGKLKAIVNVEAFERAGSLGMTQDEVAKLHGISQVRVSQLLKHKANREAWDRGRANLAERLREAQINGAIVDRDRTMLIWCGKQYLGQSDQTSKHVEIDQRVSVRYIAEWGRDNEEIEGSGQQLIEAGDDDWDEED